MCPFGISTWQKGWKVLDIETKYLHVSRDVVFYEQKFPYAVSMGPTNDPFTLSAFYN